MDLIINAPLGNLSAFYSVCVHVCAHPCVRTMGVSGSVLTSVAAEVSHTHAHILPWCMYTRLLVGAWALNWVCQES